MVQKHKLQQMELPWTNALHFIFFKKGKENDKQNGATLFLLCSPTPSCSDFLIVWMMYFPKVILFCSCWKVNHTQCKMPVNISAFFLFFLKWLITSIEPFPTCRFTVLWDTKLWDGPLSMRRALSRKVLWWCIQSTTPDNK